MTRNAERLMWLLLIMGGVLWILTLNLLWQAAHTPLY